MMNKCISLLKKIKSFYMPEKSRVLLLPSCDCPPISNQQFKQERRTSCVHSHQYIYWENLVWDKFLQELYHRFNHHSWAVGPCIPHATTKNCSCFLCWCKNRGWSLFDMTRCFVLRVASCSWRSKLGCHIFNACLSCFLTFSWFALRKIN
jgi:hypothetical protein